MAVANDETRSALERELAGALAQLPEPTRAIAIEQFAVLLHHITETERMRCAELCRARAKMWRTTRMARDESHAPGMLEARARANEAEFLADALETPPDTEDALDA